MSEHNVLFSFFKLKLWLVFVRIMPEDIACQSQISTSIAIEFEMENLFSIISNARNQVTQTSALRIIPRPSRLNQNDVNLPPPIRFVRKNRGSVNPRIGLELCTSASASQASYQHQTSNAYPTTASTSANMKSAGSYATSDYDKIFEDLMLGDDDHDYPTLIPEPLHMLNSR
jgi:hypothetical protein